MVRASPHMSLLDRFRGQSRHRHSDPAVRLAYVTELPMADREALVAFAREDEDPRVRRAAVGKLMDPSALAAVAREEPDEGVRDLAIEMLRDIALEAFEGVGEPEGVAAVDSLADPRTLAHVARSSTREVVARRALVRVTDGRSLGSIARHAALEAIRQAALDALNGPENHAEIVAIAMNAEFKDAALTALDRLSDRAELELVASRATNKSAAKRARSLIREMDERAAEATAAAGPPVPDVIDVGYADRLRIIDQLEASAGAQETRAVEEALAQAEAGWSSIEDTPPLALGARFTTTLDRVRRRLADLREKEAEDARARAAVEAVRLNEERGGRARLDAALREAEKQAARRQLRLEELVAEAGAAVDDVDLVSARKRVALVRREWNDLVSSSTVDPAMESRLAAAEVRLADRNTAAVEAEAKTRREALARVQQLASRAEPLAVKADLTLKAGERALRDIRMMLAAIPPLPSKRDYDEVTRRLKAIQAALMPRVQELREAEAWKRFANVGVQEQLCVKMEGLRALEDPEAIAHQIRDLQHQWRQVADVPRAQGEVLWHRFKAAHDELWARCEAHFAAQARIRAECLAKKIALCERVEALSNSTRWIETAEEIKRIQAEWKTIGPASRGQEKAIWERFRAACDRFFTRRHDDLVQRKAIWAENLAKKDALCAQAETLAESTEWEAAGAEIKRLQAQWKTIGPVKKSRSEAIWRRFRAACDRFFARYAQRHEVARAERVAAREAICAQLEAVADSTAEPAAAGSASSGGAQTGADVLAVVRAFRSRWQQELAASTVDRDRAAALDRRFRDALDRVIARWPAVFGGTDLDPHANRHRMETLVTRIEEVAASLAGPLDEDVSPTTRLATMLKEALAANTIGGKVDEESRWRAAADEVRRAQASWSRIGPVPEEIKRALADRFQRACRRIADGRAGESGKARATGS